MASKFNPDAFGWILRVARSARSSKELSSPPEEFNLVLKERDPNNHTRQWRFSHPDAPGEEIIVARFRLGSPGFPVHQHPHVEEFWFLTPGIWTQGDQEMRVGGGNYTNVASNEPHGWRPDPGFDYPGVMVIRKVAPAASLT